MPSWETTRRTRGRDETKPEIPALCGASDGVRQMRRELGRVVGWRLVLWLGGRSKHGRPRATAFCRCSRRTYDTRGNGGEGQWAESSQVESNLADGDALMVPEAGRGQEKGMSIANGAAESAFPVGGVTGLAHHGAIQGDAAPPLPAACRGALTYKYEVLLQTE